jgi:hypothetical protein
MPATITDRLARLDCETPARVLRRAQEETFAFALLATVPIPGEHVEFRVRNESHPEPAAHQYRVTVREGRPIACTCPADAEYDAACKHRVAVAIRPPVLTAARRLADSPAAGRPGATGSASAGVGVPPWL